MGNGMLLVTTPESAENMVQQLAQSGYQAQVAGYLTAETGVTLRVAAGELKYE
jgi:phosphoribosylformylglycinamidine cyclo-ligase